MLFSVIDLHYVMLCALTYCFFFILCLADLELHYVQAALVREGRWRDLGPGQ